MALTLGGLLGIPAAINDELKRRNELQSEALATRILGKVTGEYIPPHPLHFNPYVGDGEQHDESAISHAETNVDRNWGNNGSWGSNGW